MTTLAHIINTPLRLLLTAAAWIVMSACAVAQNNPYKISDRLYPLYQRAFQQRVRKECISLADQPYA